MVVVNVELCVAKQGRCMNLCWESEYSNLIKKMNNQEVMYFDKVEDKSYTESEFKHIICCDMENDMEELLHPTTMDDVVSTSKTINISSEQD